MHTSMPIKSNKSERRFMPKLFITGVLDVAVVFSVCSQNAVHYIDSKEDVKFLLKAPGKSSRHCSTKYLR